MLDAARRGVKHVEGYTKDDFFSDDKTIDAVRTCIAVIGEAASKMSQETRVRYSRLPWREMQGMRNLLIHVYYSINVGVLWATVSESLPTLIEQLEDVAKKLKD